MSKHTEAPWELIEFDGPVDNLMGAGFAIRAKSAPGGIAHTIGGLGDEEKPNAKLITAAPELKDALLAWKEYENGPSKYSWDEVQQIVNAALKKAGA